MFWVLSSTSAIILANWGSWPLCAAYFSDVWASGLAVIGSTIYLYYLDYWYDALSGISYDEFCVTYIDNWSGISDAIDPNYDTQHGPPIVKSMAPDLSVTTLNGTSKL